jgi:hypothetical protein
MKNTSQPMDVTIVDLGNETVGGSTPLHMVSLARAEPERGAYKKRQRAKTAKVWNDFESIVVDGVKKSQCMWCKKLFAITKSSTTSTITRHLSKCVKYRESNKKQQTLSFDPSDTEGFGTLSTFSFNENKVRELASHMVLFHEYPFNFMEHEIFNKFMKACTPHWKKISRTTVKNDCISTYNIEKKKLKALICGLDKVNITTDMWTSAQRVSYMVVTCHFIDSNWVIQKRVLSFCNIPPPYSGVVIANALRSCFEDWGILDKMFSITLDNASANTAAIKNLRDEFELRGLFPSGYGGRLFHVRCCAHVINLLVQAGLSTIEDIVDSVHVGVKYIVASEGRLKAFSEIARRLKLPSKKLILDVPTRWNSTYMMLATAIGFKEVFPRYSSVEPAFQWVVSAEEWEKVENVNQFLGIFNDVTNIVSGSDYPTSNLFLPQIWRIKEILNIKSRERNGYIRDMASVMEEKFQKYWGDCNLLMSWVVVLDPRFKMKFINFCFPMIYDTDEHAEMDEARENIKTVMAALRDYYEFYLAAHNMHVMKQASEDSNAVNSSNVSGLDVGPKVATGTSRFLDYVRSTEIIKPLKTDLDIYLEDDVFILEKDGNGVDIEPNFDALAWWKASNLKYKILSKMAQDILVVPMSSVASESAFSAGGRVIEPHRASLSPETIQILLCGSDWVRALYGVKKKAAVVVSNTFIICIYFFYV